MTEAPSARVRVYHTVRTAHLERAHALAPATIYFRTRRFDFDDDQASGLDLRHATRLGVAAALVRHPPEVLELNEPLMLTALPGAFLAALAVRFGGLLRRRRTTIVSYAIENRDPFVGRVPPRRRLRRALDRGMARTLTRQLDRVAFGTEGAEALYRRLLGRPLTGVRTACIPALPAACSCPAAEADPTLVLFVGAFEARKGLEPLLKAWPQVVAHRPEAHLVLVGGGPLLPRAEQAARTLPGVTVVVTPPRSEVHGWQRRATVAVLLSQATRSWREQVGLPIVEGLAHGCEVVTTDQTGLAAWLAAHGHAVLDCDADPEAVADAVVARLDTPRPAARVIADLPSEDGRLAADSWLTGGPYPGVPSA